MKLAVHHHAVCYRASESGTLWLPSFIGRWVDALAENFDEIVLLTHQSAEHSEVRQDYRITRRNVRLITMGPPGRTWDRIPRMRRIKAACQTAGQQVDGLLVRGFTPRQYSVWRWTRLRNRAYLLVGSLRRGGSELGTNWVWRLYNLLVRWQSDRELAKIASQGLMIANSPGLVQELDDAFGGDAVFVPTNTISEREFSPARTRPISSPLKLMFCGRIVEEKGIREAITAVGILCRAGTDTVLHVVGSGPAQTRQALHDHAVTCGVEGNVSFRGAVPYGAGLLRLYREADLFVMPTYYPEGFPHVIWEAASQSCPVITSPAGGIPALIEHGVHALFVPPRDAKTLAQAIESLVKDPGLRERLVVNAHQRAYSFTVESCAEKLWNILAERWA